MKPIILPVLNQKLFVASKKEELIKMLEFVRVKSCKAIALSTLLLTSVVVANLRVALAQDVTKFPVAKEVLPEFAPKKVAPGRDRFLEGPALTTDGLVQAIRSNRVFRVSLAKHFGLSESRLISFIKDALVPFILPKDTVVSNYGITKSGLIYSKKMTLKKGTRVWATRDGKPILKWVCSNPLLAKAPVLKDRPQVSSVSRQKFVGMKQVATTVKEPEGVQALEGGQVALKTPREPILVASQPVEPIDISSMADQAVASVASPEELGSLLDPITPAATGLIPGAGIPGISLLSLTGGITSVVRSVKPPKPTNSSQKLPKFPNSSLGTTPETLTALTDALVPSEIRNAPSDASVESGLSPSMGGAGASGGLGTSSTAGDLGGGNSLASSAAAPEPGSLSLVALGMMLASLKRLRKARSL